MICGSARLANLRLERRGAEPSAEGTAGEPRTIVAEGAAHRRVDEPDTGMCEVSAAITKMMCASGVAMLLRQIPACLAGLVTSEERADALRKSFREIVDHMDEIVKLGSSMLRTQLRDTVRNFAEEQADELLHALPRAKTLQCDVRPLRAHLEGDYLAGVERIAAELVRIEQFLYPHLRVIVAGLLPDYDGDLLAAPHWPVATTPSTAALSRSVAMDLESGGGSDGVRRGARRSNAPSTSGS